MILAWLLLALWCAGFWFWVWSTRNRDDRVLDPGPTEPNQRYTVMLNVRAIRRGLPSSPDEQSDEQEGRSDGD